MGDDIVRFRDDLFPGNGKIRHVGTIYRKNSSEDLMMVGPAFSRDGYNVWFYGARDEEGYVLVGLVDVSVCCFRVAPHQTSSAEDIRSLVANNVVNR